MSITKPKKRSSIKSKVKEKKTYSSLIFKKSDENPRYNTPKEVYESLNKEFHFTFQPTMKSFDGNWGKRVFVNTPFRDPTVWVEQGLSEISKGHTDTAVFLLKGDTSTSLFHDLVIPNAKELRAVRGRLSFSGKGNSPFGSIIAVFGKSIHGSRIKKQTVKRPKIVSVSVEEVKEGEKTI